MALYRLHKGDWENQLRSTTEAWKAKTGKDKGDKHVDGEEQVDTEVAKHSRGKRKRHGAEDENEDEDGHNGERSRSISRDRKEEFPGGGRKGLSSGLGVIVRRNGQMMGEAKRGRGAPAVIARTDWWAEAAK